MKLKYLLFIVIISFSFFFIDNVKAEGYVYTIPDTLIPVFENYTFNTWSTASESSNYNKFKKQIDDVLNKKTSIECVNEIVDNYSNYIFIYGNGNNKAIFWNGDDYEARFGGGYGSYWSSGKQVNGTKIGLYNSISTGNEKVIYLPADSEYTCSNNYSWTDKQATNTTPLLSYTGQGSNVPNDIITNYNNGYFPTVYTNQDIKVGNYYDGKTTGDFGVSVSYVYDSFTLNGKTYNVGDVIIPRNDISTPTISITKENENTIKIGEIEYITDVNLNIDFSIIDNDKYLYLVSLDGGNNWQTYTLTQSTSVIINVKENCTVIAQMLDKSTNEYITGATYTITSIVDNNSSNEKVKIKFQKITKEFDSELYNQCTISQFSISYRACETIAISFDTINYNKYIYEMSLDGGNNWVDLSTRIYNNFFLERLFENKTIYIRVLNKSDYSYNSSATYKEATIDSTEELGQIVLFDSNYYVQSPDIDVTALFINYDSNSYNYYYSLTSNEESFVNITDSIDCINNLCTYKIRVYVKGTVYVKIEDKAGNIVYTATYNVDYYRWMNKNNPFDKDDFFDAFFNSFDYFLNPIKEIFNTISVFFDSLPIEIKYTFYVAFVIMIILFLIKFIL